MANPNKQEFEAKLFEKAQTDQAFRKRLLADPKATVSGELGVPIPDGITIRVIEDDSATVTFVLPPNAATEELSDAELDAVAGGMAPKNPNCGPTCPAKMWSWITL